LKTSQSFFHEENPTQAKLKKPVTYDRKAPHQVCCNLLVHTIINRLGSHYSNVPALTGTFIDGTDLAPYFVISIFSYPKKKIISCLLAYLLLS